MKRVNLNFKKEMKKNESFEVEEEQAGALKELAQEKGVTLSEKEKQQILLEFNNTKTAYPRDKTIDRLFLEEAEKHPDRTAVVGSLSLTYKELNERSGRLAMVLKEKGIQTDTIVGIMLERSPYMVTGLLGILKAGGAYLPISPRSPGERVSFMLKESGARLLVTADSPAGAEGKTVDRPGGESRPASLAYINYTSGSTGIPKGVMVEHLNVVRLVKNSNFVQLEKGDRVLQTGALEFDASTFEIWGALLNGLELYLVSNEIILSPGGLKETVRKNCIATMWMTSPLFNQMLQEDTCIFKGLKNLLVGGDALSPVHINRLRGEYADLNIINGYGPTENTTFSTTYLITKEHKKNIPIGKPIANSTAYIVDAYNDLLPPGVPGELIVGGDGVSRGYLNNPELTAEKFIHSSPFTLHPSLIYKTGDRARWLQDGNIEFLGRMDEQLKIRGFRIELGEIENRLLGRDDVKEAVVIPGQDKNGDKYLCAYIVLNEKTPGITELREFLLKKLPGYMVPSYFVTLDKIPLTANGKVDRKSLPKARFEAAAGYTAPGNEVEEKLVETWSKVLDLDKEIIGIDDNFFELGGHSLKAAGLISDIHKEFNVKIPLTEIFTMPFIRGLAGYINDAARETYRSIEAVEEMEYYPVSPAQKRMYILQQIAPQSAVYNIPTVVELEEDLDMEKLEHIFQQLIRRHESLRTSFHLIREEFCQGIHNDVEFKIEYDEAPAPRAFDLSAAPLLRVVVMKKNGTGSGHLLMVDMHHIIADGTSQEILVKDFMALQAGDLLPPLPLRYRDFSQWQNRQIVSGAVKSQEDYWLKEFQGEIPVLELPTDYPRPQVQAFEGFSRVIELSRQEIESLRAITQKEDATMFMVVLAIFKIFLARLGGQEDIIVGTPTAGRSHADLEQIMGMFVNTLALRNYPREEKRFTEFLREVKKQTLAAFDNQDYQFEDLVNRVLSDRDTGRNPLFDVMFSYRTLGAHSLRSMASEEGEEAGDGPQVYNYEIGRAKFDMVLAVEEVDSQLFTVMVCNGKLFKEETVQRFICYFKEVLAAVVENETVEIGDIKISIDLGTASTTVFQDSDSEFEF